MMPRLLLLLAALPLAMLPACKEGGDPAGAPGTGSGASAGGSGSGLGTLDRGGSSGSGWEEFGEEPLDPRVEESLPEQFERVAASALPDFRYLEEQRVRAEREVLFYEFNIVETGFHEVLLADGDGNFRLDPVEVLDEQDPRWDPAPLQLLAEYEARGRFLVRFRDPHLGHPHAYGTNYDWYRDLQPHQVAGRACTLWAGRSRYGFGGIDLLVDDASGVVLGWTLLNQGMSKRASGRVTALDLDPDLDGVQWQGRAVASETYEPDLHAQRLGFTPFTPTYLPPGFYIKSQEVLASGPLLGEPHDMHVFLLHDGVLPLFVVQQKSGSAPDDQPVTTARHSRVAGIEMYEGRIEGIETWVTGTLPAVELHTVFGGMMR